MFWGSSSSFADVHRLLLAKSVFLGMVTSRLSWFSFCNNFSFSREDLSFDEMHRLQLGLWKWQRSRCGFWAEFFACLMICMCLSLEFHLEYLFQLVELRVRNTLQLISKFIFYFHAASPHNFHSGMDVETRYLFYRLILVQLYKDPS